MKPDNCMECEHSCLTVQNYCRCRLTGNCYSPIIMSDKISDDCPLYKKDKEESNMLCTVTVDVDTTSDAIAFLNCIDQLSYIDIKSIEVKEEKDANND